MRRLTLEALERRWLLSAESLTNPPVLTASATTGNSANLTSEEASVSQSVDAFALDLYAELQGTTGGNLFVSPFSIATALAMTYAGAGGQTAQQMASVLHLGSDTSSVESDFGAFLNDLNSAGQSGGYVLSVANALWAQQGLDILPEFLNVIQSDFSGALNQADFVHDAETARQTINDWVAQQTHDRIQGLFPPGSITDMTRLVLANAIYFKGSWASAFNASQTTDAPFTLASGNQVTVSTMHQTADFRYMQSNGFQVLELPYADGRLAMDVLLPTQAGLPALGSNQIPADITSWISGLGDAQVQVSLPKFTMTTQFNLIPPLAALGMTDAFSTGADFSGITDPSQLYVSTVVHKAFISVDETGTEAAAATGVGVSVSVVQADPPPPVIFNADHPFLFLIRDTQSGTVLFMGQIENPNEQGSDASAPVITQQPRGQDPVSTPVTPVPVTPSPVIPSPVLPSPVAPTKQLPIGQPIASNPPVSNIPPLTGPFNPAPASSPLSPNEKLVDAFYQSLLGRTAEPTALAYWSKQLESGASRTSVVNDIEASSEYRQDEVESLYEHYLGRRADTTGLDYFAGQLAAGATVERVATSLAGSQEFLIAHGLQSKADVANLVDSLFSTILGRSADTSGSAHFSQELAAGETASQVAAQLLASDEYQKQLVGAAFTKLLDRPADTAAADHFASELRAGATDEQVIGQVLSSDEFYARATSG